MTWIRKRSTTKVVADAAEAGVQKRDQRLLGQLLQTGARLGQLRTVSYYLYMPDEDSAQLAANDIRHAGFEARLRPPLSEYPDQWPVIAVLENCPLTVEVIRANSAFFDSIVARHGGDYDGWQATT